MDLNAAHTHAALLGEKLRVAVFTDASCNQRSCYNGAEAFHHERAVNRQAKRQIARFGCDSKRQTLQLSFDGFQTLAGSRAGRNDGSIFEKRPSHQFLNFKPYQIKHVTVGQIALGDYNEPFGNAQQATDIKMLARLWLDGFVRRHHQQNQVDSAGARQHVLHEPLVAGNIDKTYLQPVAQVEVSESQVNRDAAPLLFFQPIRIDARERPHQGGLAVVNVACGSNHKMSHRSFTRNLASDPVLP